MTVQRRDCCSQPRAKAAKARNKPAPYDKEAEVQDGAVEGGEMEEGEAGRSEIEEGEIEER